jgi:HEAT repeat protein
LLPRLIQYLKTEGILRETATTILLERSTANPLTIIEKLIIEKDTESFIRKGILCITIIQIGVNNPQKVIPFLSEKVTDTRPNVRDNVIGALSELSVKYPNEIVLKPLLTLWMSEISTKLKIDIAKAVVNVALANPDKIKPFMPTLLKGLSDPDKSLRKTVAKLFVDLAEKAPDLIPLSVLKNLTQDADPSVRESGMILLKAVGLRFPKESLEYLTIGLRDKEWNVKNAAADSIGELGSKIATPELLNMIKALLKDSEKWTRLKAIEVIQKAVENKAKILSLDEVIELLARTDEEESFQVNVVKLLGSVGADDFKKSFPYMIKMLTHSNQKVREGMISGMIKLSVLIPMKTLLPNLLKYFSDETEMALQQSIALLLNRIVRYETPEIKNRVISLLKIRCEMSQDAIICDVLSNLQKS